LTGERPRAIDPYLAGFVAGVAASILGAAGGGPDPARILSCRCPACMAHAWRGFSDALRAAHTARRARTTGADAPN
jgi:hypothetical protein